MLYVVIEIIIKTLQFAMFELPQDLIKCVEKMVVVTDTDEKLLQVQWRLDDFIVQTNAIKVVTFSEFSCLRKVVL